MKVVTKANQLCLAVFALPIEICLTSRKREPSTVTCMTMDGSSEEMLEVCQEEPKEEPVYDIALPNSTSYVHSIAGGGGVVIRHL